MKPVLGIEMPELMLDHPHHHAQRRIPQAAKQYAQQDIEQAAENGQHPLDSLHVHYLHLAID
jgi:hypothetical protein